MDKHDNTSKEEARINSDLKVKTKACSNEQSKENDASKNEVKEVKKDKRPSKIELSEKSELFKSIIDIALSCEKLEEDRKKLKNKNKNLSDEIKELKEQKEEIKGELEAADILCQKKQEEIDQLRVDINHRNEVIQIQKADKVESAQEFKNALAASLKTYMQDFCELKSMDMSEEVGYAMAETLDGVFKILCKNGINI